MMIDDGERKIVCDYCNKEMLERFAILGKVKEYAQKDICEECFADKNL